MEKTDENLPPKKKPKRSSDEWAFISVAYIGSDHEYKWPKKMKPSDR